jgi:hypothetical protein
VVVATSWVGPVIFAIGLGLLLYGLVAAGARRSPSFRCPASLDRLWLFALSLIILLAALLVILSNRYDDATEKWAFGAIGTIIGFWFVGAGR